jgi:hypothetical protein
VPDDQDPEEVEQQLQEAELAIGDALSDVLSRQGLMVTKWMCVAEVIGADGSRALESFASPDIRAWDTLGMLGYLDARERGAVGADAAGPDGG